MVDSIRNIGSAQVQRSATTNPASAPNAALRNNPVVLDAIVKTQSATTQGTRTALAVPQSAKNGSSSTTKLPRGSLIDVVA